MEGRRSNGPPGSNFLFLLSIPYQKVISHSFLLLTAFIAASDIVIVIDVPSVYKFHKEDAFLSLMGTIQKQFFGLLIKVAL